MRRLVVVAGVLASRVASADVATISFGDGHGLDGWKALPTTGYSIAGGELVQDRAGRFTRAVPLDARGWAIEARFALEQDNSGVEITVVDDRTTTRFTRQMGYAVLDGEHYEMPDPKGMHTFRIEAAAGRKLLLVDGQVVVDHDMALPIMTLDPQPSILFGAVTKGTSTAPAARWAWLGIDTAPTGLAISSVPFQPATRFTGPFAPWFFRFGSRATQIASALSKLQLPEKARACVAFDIVASASVPRPKRYRLGNLAKLPKNMPPEPPQIDFDLIESPRQARKPMMRRRRAPADIRAQVELAGALSAKDPAMNYDRAVNLIVNEASLPTEALTWLMAQLPELAQHPDACR